MADFSLQVAHMIQRQGKELFSLHESKAFTGLLGAVLLALVDAEAVRIAPSDSVPRAELLVREIELPPHLQPFLESANSATVVDFMEVWTALDSTHRDSVRTLWNEELEEPDIKGSCEAKLLRMQEGEEADPRLYYLLQQSDLANALFSLPMRRIQEENLEGWMKDNPMECELIEALPSLWLMRFVQ